MTLYGLTRQFQALLRDMGRHGDSCEARLKLHPISGGQPIEGALMLLVNAHGDRGLLLCIDGLMRPVYPRAQAAADALLNSGYTLGSRPQVEFKPLSPLKGASWAAFGVITL